MPFSYDQYHLDDTLNLVRLKIGDTDSQRPLLYDEEIKQMIAEQSSTNLAIAACCRLICAKFAGDPDRYRIENFTESFREVYDRYEKLAKVYAAKGGGAPWVGSKDVDFKTATELNTDLVSPSFKRGMHNNK